MQTTFPGNSSVIKTGLVATAVCVKLLVCLITNILLYLLLPECFDRNYSNITH